MSRHSKVPFGMAAKVYLAVLLCLILMPLASIVLAAEADAKAEPQVAAKPEAKTEVKAESNNTSKAEATADTEIEASGNADARVLIDVSGSMKQNDPDNLRRPALRLLVGLLPKNSRAAVWTFGQFVNQQIPLGKVDKGWKERALKSAGKIHSRGLYTDIEQVLKRSTADWKKPESKYDRHLILLTDGMVDISKSSMKNAKSRRNILTTIIPKLKKLGVKVHTIALSKRADHRLMEKLSENTDGWFEQANDADQLKRIFLRIFEKVGKPDTVPLKDNKFRIDKSVKEATLLVFRSDESKPPTKVKTPGGNSFGSDDPPEGVSWHRDDGYDLLTISNPETGEWQIEAEIDPDNRVMVVTDLKMVTGKLPNRLLQGEQSQLKISFTDQGKKITNKEFLEVVDVRSEYTGGEEVTEPQPVYDDGKSGDKKAGDGIFTHVTGKDIGKGKIELILTAEGKTFVREKRYTFESIPAVTVDRLDGERKGKAGLMATVIPEPNLVVGQSLELEAYLVPKEGDSRSVMFLPGPDGMSRETWIDRSELGGTWNLEVHVKAKSVSGTQLEVDLDPIPIEGELAAAPVSVAKQSVVKEPEPKPEPKSEPKPEPKAEPKTEAETEVAAVPDNEPETESESEPKAEPESKPEPESETVAETEANSEEQSEEGGIPNAVWFILLNLVVLLGGGGAYWFINKRRGTIYSELMSSEEAEAMDEAKESPASDEGEADDVVFESAEADETVVMEKPEEEPAEEPAEEQMEEMVELTEDDEVIKE